MRGGAVNLIKLRRLCGRHRKQVLLAKLLTISAKMRRIYGRRSRQDLAASLTRIRKLVYRAAALIGIWSDRVGKSPSLMGAARHPDPGY